MDGYDETQDRCLWERGEVFADQFNRLSLAIYQYGEKGKPKLQISREKHDKKSGRWSFSKLGRMTLAEFSAVARAVKEGFDVIEKTRPRT